MAGCLLVVSGPSGVGKGTICKELVQRYPDVNLSVSATTRKPRRGEVEGVSYYFKTVEEFRALIDAEMMLEYAEMYGNYYGTPKQPVLDAIERGSNIILEIEMKGAKQVIEKYPDAVFVFILPPSLDVLLRRISGRGSETAESLKRRMDSAMDEIEGIRDYDYYIVNDCLDEAVEELKQIIDEVRAGRGHTSGIDKQKVEQIIEAIREGKNVTTINR